MKQFVISCYDKNQYQIQLRQLQALKQTDSVTTYHSQFEELSHGILRYNPSYDEPFFVTQFLGGLKEEIRSAIALHRPKTMQDASELAMLQELELEVVKPRSVIKPFNKF